MRRRPQRSRRKLTGAITGGDGGTMTFPRTFAHLEAYAAALVLARQGVPLGDPLADARGPTFVRESRDNGFMRLYLSSYQLGDHPEAFTGLVRGSGRGWVIMNAFDGADPEMRSLETERQVMNLAGVGLAARELDLRAHDAESLSVKFGQPDFLWVRGGNVFTLRAALARSGADALIADRLRADELVYAGFSAGVCVLAPSLLGLEECDSTEDALSMYGAVEFDGLSILDRPFVPHLGSPEHPESEALTPIPLS